MHALESGATSGKVRAFAIRIIIRLGAYLGRARIDQLILKLKDQKSSREARPVPPTRPRLAGHFIAAPYLPSVRPCTDRLVMGGHD